MIGHLASQRRLYLDVGGISGNPALQHSEIKSFRSTEIHHMVPVELLPNSCNTAWGGAVGPQLFVTLS